MVAAQGGLTRSGEPSPRPTHPGHRVKEKGQFYLNVIMEWPQEGMGRGPSANILCDPRPRLQSLCALFPGPEQKLLWMPDASSSWEGSLNLLPPLQLPIRGPHSPSRRGGSSLGTSMVGDPGSLSAG